MGLGLGLGLGFPLVIASLAAIFFWRRWQSRIAASTNETGGGQADFQEHKPPAWTADRNSGTSELDGESIARTAPSPLGLRAFTVERYEPVQELDDSGRT